MHERPQRMQCRRAVVAAALVVAAVAAAPRGVTRAKWRSVPTTQPRRTRPVDCDRANRGGDERHNVRARESIDLTKLHFIAVELDSTHTCVA